MTQRIEQVVIGFDRKAGCTSNDRRAGESKCLLGIRLSCGILNQPFENHICIEDDYHDRSTDRTPRNFS